MRLATNASRGRATSSPAVPSWTTCALDDDADPVGERRGVLEVVRDEDRRQPELARGARGARRGPAPSCARRAPRAARRGAAPAGVAGERARERDPLALAARELRGRARARAPPIRNRSSSSVHRRAAAARRSGRSRRRRGAGRARTPGTGSRPRRSSGGRSMPARRVEPGRRRRPRPCRCRGRRRPATTRSVVVFPAPDGPTSASGLRRARPSARRRVEGAKGMGVVDPERHRVSSLTDEQDAAADRDEHGADRERDVEVEVELLVDRERERLRRRPGASPRT